MEHAGKWVKAKDLKSGMQAITDDNKLIKIKKVETANWIKTSEGNCIWIFFADRSDQIAGKSDEYWIKA